MTGNNSGTFELNDAIEGAGIYSNVTGRVSVAQTTNANSAHWSSNQFKRWKYTIDFAHTHTLPNSYIYGKTDGESQNHTHSVTASGTISGDSETRPNNYTIRVWKRVS